jgi:hypothetical protein
MAKDVKIQKSVRGKPLAEWLTDPSSKPGAGVAKVVRDRAREIEFDAEVLLIQHSDTGATTVESRQMRKAGKFASGWEVLLIDHGAGYQGAIEYGRKDYLVEDSEQAQKAGFVVKEVKRRIKGVPKKTAKLRVIRRLGQTYGGMDGLFILTKAVKIVAARHRIELR